MVLVLNHIINFLFDHRLFIADNPQEFHLKRSGLFTIK